MRSLKNEVSPFEAINKSQEAHALIKQYQQYLVADQKYVRFLRKKKKIPQEEQHNPLLFY